MANQAAQHGLSLPLEKEREYLEANPPRYEQASRLRGTQRAARDISMHLAIIFPINKRQDIARFISMHPNHTCFLPKARDSTFQPQEQLLSRGSNSKPSSNVCTGTQTSTPREQKPGTITYSCQTGNLGQIVRHRGPELKKTNKKSGFMAFSVLKKALAERLYMAKGGGEDLPSASQASWSWLRSWKSSGTE